jgi:hypothetical protein
MAWNHVNPWEPVDQECLCLRAVEWRGGQAVKEVLVLILSRWKGSCFWGEIGFCLCFQHISTALL